MIWYVCLVILILISLSLSFFYKRRNSNRCICRVLNVILMLSFSLIIAFRPNSIPDTLSYKEIFDDIKPNKDYGFDVFGEYNSVEFGFLYFIKIYKLFSSNVTGFFFIFCLLSVAITMHGINNIVLKYKRQRMCFPLVFAFYISYFGIYYNGIAIRQGFAIALCIWAISLFLNKKYFRSLILFFISFLFHRLSFIAIIILLLLKITNRIRFSKTAYTLIFCVLLIYCFSGFGYVINKYAFKILLDSINLIGLGGAYNSYLENFTSFINGFPYRVVLNILLGFLLIVVIEKNDICKSLLNIYLLGIMALCVLFGISAIYRGADYFLFFSVIIVACSFTFYKKDNNEKSSFTDKKSEIKKVGCFSAEKYVAVTLIIFANLVNILNVINSVV